jgi:hypothetical protein
MGGRADHAGSASPPFHFNLRERPKQGSSRLGFFWIPHRIRDKIGRTMHYS